MNPQTSERSGIQSVEVGFALLRVLAQSSQTLMLRDLASSAGMSPAKAHRYLVSYQRLGLVTQDSATTRYDLGPAALQLGLSALARVDAVRMARERVPQLLAQIGHTVALAVWGNHGPTLIHWEESENALTVNLRLGDVMPLLTSATGRCFAAFNQRGTSKQAMSALIEAELVKLKGTRHADAPVSKTEVRQMIEQVRQQGFGRVVNTLLPGISGACVPVFDADGHLALGIVALGNATTFDATDNSTAIALLRQTAEQLSRDLGWRGTHLAPTAATGTAKEKPARKQA
jgi:DNA-binding IclR family transcriptional regulator